MASRSSAMLPDDRVLRDALDTLEVQEGAQPTREGDIIAAPRRELGRPDGQRVVDQSDLLLCQTGGAISAARLVERVADALHVARHPHVAKTDPLRAPIAAAVLAMVVLKRRRN